MGGGGEQAEYFGPDGNGTKQNPLSCRSVNRTDAMCTNKNVEQLDMNMTQLNDVTVFKEQSNNQTNE